MIDLLKKLFHKILWYSYQTWLYISWNDWNPWRHASLNVAWENYKKTTMYQDRLKIDFLPIEPWWENYAMKAYEDNREYFFFRSKFTLIERLKIIMFPFSCGNRFKVHPLAKLKVWWYGIESDDIDWR